MGVPQDRHQPLAISRLYHARVLQTLKNGTRHPLGIRASFSGGGFRSIDCAVFVTNCNSLSNVQSQSKDGNENGNAKLRSVSVNVSNGRRSVVDSLAQTMSMMRNKSLEMHASTIINTTPFHHWGLEHQCRWQETVIFRCRNTWSKSLITARMISAITIL